MRREGNIVQMVNAMQIELDYDSKVGEGSFKAHNKAHGVCSYGKTPEHAMKRAREQAFAIISQEGLNKHRKIMESKDKKDNGRVECQDTLQ